MTLPARTVASADAGVGREVAGAVGLGDDLGAGLAGAVGVVPAERVALGTAAVRPEIALVAGDHDDRAQRRQRRAASSRLTTPRMLVCKVVTGSSRPR